MPGADRSRSSSSRVVAEPRKKNAVAENDRNGCGHIMSLNISIHSVYDRSFLGALLAVVKISLETAQ